MFVPCLNTFVGMAAGSTGDQRYPNQDKWSFWKVLWCLNPNDNDDNDKQHENSHIFFATKVCKECKLLQWYVSQHERQQANIYFKVCVKGGGSTCVTFVYFPNTNLCFYFIHCIPIVVFIWALFCLLDTQKQTHSNIHINRMCVEANVFLKGTNLSFSHKS